MVMMVVKIGLVYILGGMVSFIGFCMLYLPLIIKSKKYGIDYDSYFQEACEIVKNKYYSHCKLYSALDSLSVKKFYAINFLLWPILSIWTAVCYSRIVKNVETLVKERNLLREL